MAEIRAEEIISRACEAAGFQSFDLPDLRTGLDRNLDALTRTPFAPHAREQALAKLGHDLTTRLRIERWHEENPDASRQQIEGPVLVFGLPRTGTSAAVAMLALDERFRFLRAWEGLAPLPPPIAGEEDGDPRVLKARAAASNYSKPEMHLHDPDGPEEDLVFLAGLNMRSFHGAAPIPQDYLDWWMQDDFRSTYALHQRVLQMLQSTRPPHLWLLKAPPHLFKLEAFAAQYPNAKFVMTHRDPRKIIGSLASLTARLYSERCDASVIDKHMIGERVLWFWTEGMQRGLKARTRIGEHRFIDVTNDQVVKTPLQTFERIYAHLDMTLNPDLRERLLAYSARNAPGVFGAHRYTLEEYGLSAESVGHAFENYIERFDL